MKIGACFSNAKVSTAVKSLALYTCCKEAFQVVCIKNFFSLLFLSFCLLPGTDRELEKDFMLVL